MKLDLDTRTARIVDLEPNPWNPNRMTERLFESTRESIRVMGFIDPVTVCVPKAGSPEWPSFPTWEKGRYLIVDGEHRTRAAQEEGLDAVGIVVVPLKTEAEARKLTLIFLQHGDPVAGDLLKCLKILEEQMGEDARVALPYEAGDIARLKKIAEAEAQGEEGGGEEFTYFSFHVPKDAAEVIRQAIAHVQGQHGAKNQGLAVEMICADYLAGIGDADDVVA